MLSEHFLFCRLKGRPLKLVAWILLFFYTHRLYPRDLKTTITVNIRAGRPFGTNSDLHNVAAKFLNPAPIWLGSPTMDQHLCAIAPFCPSTNPCSTSLAQNALNVVWPPIHTHTHTPQETEIYNRYLPVTLCQVYGIHYIIFVAWLRTSRETSESDADSSTDSHVSRRKIRERFRSVRFESLLEATWGTADTSHLHLFRLDREPARCKVRGSGHIWLKISEMWRSCLIDYFFCPASRLIQVRPRNMQ